MPLVIDDLVIYVAAKDAPLFWFAPQLPTRGSVAGGAVWLPGGAA